MLKRIAVLASGNGTDLQSVIDGVTTGEIKGATVSCVISNRRSAYALERARTNNIEAIYIREKDFDSTEEYNAELVRILLAKNVDLVVLAGYLKVLSPFFVRSFKGRIINIHPSLIPDFCGKGFYGMRVHEAVISSGASVTGATVHFVDSGVDTGPIILQERVCVMPGETAEGLAKRVLEVEHRLLPEAVRLFCEGIITPCEEVQNISRNEEVSNEKKGTDKCI